jgi:hypothetical protein
MLLEIGSVGTVIIRVRDKRKDEVAPKKDEILFTRKDSQLPAGR